MAVNGSAASGRFVGAELVIDPIGTVFEPLEHSPTPFRSPGSAQDIPSVRPVIQRRFAMRLVSFILFSVIALASSAPSACAAEKAFGPASLTSASCPVYEGYPDCDPDADVQWTEYSSRRRLSR
jgi:hypothetical protein